MEHDLRERQKELEKEAIDVRQRKEFIDLTKAIQQGRFDETFYGSALLKTYFKPIRDKVQEYLDTDYKGHTGKTQRYLKYLGDDADVLAYIVVQSLIKRLALDKNRTKVTTLAVHISKSLRTIKVFEHASVTNPKLIAYLGSEYRRASARRKAELISKHLEDFKDDAEVGQRAQDIRACSVLIDLVLHSGVGLIHKKKLFRKGIDRYSTLYVMFTDEVMETLTKMYSISPTLALAPPMIVPPRDWVSTKDGGYLDLKYTFSKIKSQKSRRILRDKDFTNVLAVINKLQQTAWRSNDRIVEVIQYIYTHNMIDPRSPPTLPRLYGGISTSIPTKAEDLIDGFGNYPENPTEEEKKTWAVWNRKREKIKIGLDGEQGRRLQYLMTMGVVQKMEEFDKFYYVYQLDYRGRVYPITDFFNPQSKGYVKAMLEFADGQLLDVKGIYWLKVHSANTYGLDKEPFADRVQWATDNRQAMLEAADDPLGNLAYWTGADSPFEFLAACMALQDHVQGRKVHLPIQLDAVNSGVQMYSGLLRDKTGAKSTCVIGDTRSDLYAEVAAGVEKRLSDSNYPPYITFTDKEGQERVVDTKIEATSMIGNFTRSMTKSNVMTVPYSVSLRGMKMQNWNVMDDMRLAGKAFWKGDEWVVNYLWTTLTHESIFDIVKGARAGQEYLKDVTRLLSTPAVWYTPIYKLPVVQANYKSKDIRIQTVLGTLSILEFTDEIKKQKQLAAIAANFIHSIDATVLMYVVDHIGADIGTIHDCFLVHPNEGDNVRDCYKEGFVKVMEADPLAMFAKELDPDGEVEIPYVGDLDLKEVYNSEYIIS